MSDRIDELRVRVDNEADLRDAQEAAQGQGLIAQESADPSDGLSQDLEPVTMLLIGGAVLAAAKFVTGLIDKWRGGLVIDQRPKAPDDIHRDRDIPWGYICVYPADGGTVTIQTKDEPKDAIERLIGQVISGTFDSATALAKAAATALSDSGKVSTTPTVPEEPAASTKS